MAWVAVAIGGSALVGGATSYFGAKRAGDQQAEAGRNALSYQQSVDQRNQQNAERAQTYFTPYMDAGKGALSKITDLYGLNGSGGNGVSDSGWTSFLQTPDYKFAFDQGRGALENSAAARGGLLSGNFARGITDYGQGMASQQFGNYYNRMAGMAQLGGAAAGGAASALTASSKTGAEMGGQIGNTMMGIGQANAAGTVGSTNALTGSASSGINNYLLYNALNKSSYGSAGPMFGGNGTQSSMGGGYGGGAFG